MALPHRLPRPEIGTHIPPRRARAKPPRDTFQNHSMIGEPPTPLTHIRGHQPLGNRPELIRNHLPHES